jgi:hypothetical protein
MVVSGMTRNRVNWWDGILWRRWVLANTGGELIGLGLAALLGFALFLVTESLATGLATLLLAISMVALGTFEGVVVGFAQWLVLRHPLPPVSSRIWVLATAIGTFVAWTLGMIPTVAIDFSGSSDAAPAPEINPVIYFGLAAMFGAVLGVIFSFPQWLVLRRYVAHAEIWIPANALAWGVAMPVVFFGASSTPEGIGVGGLVAIVAVTVILAGAVVGAIHGVALSWLVHHRIESSESSSNHV